MTPGGRAVVAMDGPAANVLHRPSRPGVAMLLDDEDVELSAGDVVIQNGTNHAWANRGHAPCLMAFVLIDAPGDPPR